METLVISDNPEIAAALARALQFFGHKHSRKPMAATGRFRIPAELAPKTVLILNVTDELLLEQLIWGKIRKDYENPLIVLGFQKAEDFGKKQPAFNGEKREPSCFSHGYKPLPFILGDLNALIKRLNPVTDLAAINKNYANEKQYLLHRIHGISAPTTRWSKNKTLARLNEVLVYFRQKGEIENAEELEAGLHLTPRNKWEDRTYDLRCLCEKLLA
ncbi:MAG TPA: hypothetical protein DEQ77_04730 [Candidatus Omnitrophica bacterium]|nr:hypothetical protein [Candidatus Omnitrophota bacterium]